MRGCEDVSFGLINGIAAFAVRREVRKRSTFLLDVRYL